ncbi:C1 family peptidase [Chitinophaga alhagiae]|uniref:C1 family peptidase n=1 Tax=Chitinophaga alhagiae TaxID=2203219 RepID=UPI000E5A96CC|nr:C1 family peptidase [Chitinophaga alhagiae]
MRKNIVAAACVLLSLQAAAQEQPVMIRAAVGEGVTILKNNAATTVKSQGKTGTCWCFSTTSLIESQCMRQGMAQPDLSEMYTVRNVYLLKARNYILRQGKAQFDEGGLGHDVLKAASMFGLMPESAYSGLKAGQEQPDHGGMVKALRTYLDTILKKRPVPADWEQQYAGIMDEYMGGAPPASFAYNGKTYTPQEFARQVVKFNEADYVSLTSFTHHPYYSNFVLELPDNHANGAFYNVTLDELIGATKTAVNKGYTVMWDADVSNRGFVYKSGYAFSPVHDTVPNKTQPNPDLEEVKVTAAYRQGLFDQLVTQDDHLMHITGIGKSKEGKPFFIVKNSWGTTSSPFDGYVYVSEPYFAVNTINVIVPKASLDKALLKKLQLN